MEKLCKYLEKIGIMETNRHARPEDTPPASYIRTTYGEEHYFYNAPGFTYPGAIVALDYNTDGPEEYFRDLDRIEKRLESYARRYNYLATRRCIDYKTVFYTIIRAEDRAAADTYYFFRDSCRQDCEQAAHELYTAGHPERVEATLRGIMDSYGAAYNERLKADEARIV